MKKKLLLFLLCACSCLVSHATAIYCTVDGIKYSIEYGSATVKECYKNGDVVIPASITYRGEDYPVTVIGSRAFEDNSFVTSVIIPSSVYYIQYWAFSGCTRLTSITIPESVKTIEADAFENCSGLVSITIPEGVKSIDFFGGCTSLTSIAIPNSVTSIGWSAFRDCSSLISITIPEGVTSIGEYAFSGCTGLTSITIPNSVTSIDGSAFNGCTGLTSITIPDGVTSIGEKAFFGCSALTSITIPEGVTSIGEYAFRGCNSLQSITIPQSVSSIGNRAFADCTGTLYVNCPLSGDRYTFRYTFDDCAFERIVVGDAVQSLPDLVFDKIKALKEVILPNTLTEIGYDAFSGCTGLTSITIPESVTRIGVRAFQECTGTLHINSNIASPLNGSFDQVILGPSVSAIGESVFRASLTTCFVVEAETPPTLAANALPNATIFIYVPQGMTEVYQNAWGKPTSTNYTYIYVEQDPSGTCGEHLTWHFNPRNGHMTIEGYGEMTDVPWQSFRTNISSLSLPQGLTSICANAFYGSKLTELQIPQGVSTIGNYAFSGCRLTELEIPEGVTTIGAYAFSSNSLTKITLPSTLTKIDPYAYSSSTKLQEVHIAAATPPALGKNVFNFGEINFVYIPQNTTVAYQAAWGTNYHYIEPDGSADITGIIGGQLSWAFNPQSGKLSIQGVGAIPNEGSSNGTQSWKIYRDYITSIELSEGITAIGNWAFSNLPNITELTIPASVTKIGYNILENSGATSLYYKATSAVVGYYFNSGVLSSSIGDWMIKGDPSTNAMFTGSQVKNITFSDNITEIPAFFFANDTALHSITIPNTVTKIGGGAFLRCSNLRSVTLPEHLTIIDTCVFQESGIDTLIIPAGVTRICQNAFRNSKLHHIEIPESVTEIERGAFAGCNLGALRLPDALTALPDYLFTASNAYGWDNSSVRSLTIGKNIRELNTYMLERCTIDSLVYNARNVVSAEREHPIYNILPSSVFSITFGDSVEVIPDYLCERTNIIKAILPNTVTKIGKYAFSECGYLTELVLSDSITSIGEYAFNKCFSLTNISLSESIQTLSAYTFASCLSLQSVHLPEQVGYIGDYAFSECGNLVNITLPKSVYHIGNSAFYACTSLQSLAYNGWYIGEDAFYKCASLSDLSFTSDVDINQYAFSNCEALKRIHFAPDTRAYIADYAFFNCYSLDTLVIPDYAYAAATIGAYAFKSCSGLRSVSLGTSVQSVGKQAFYGCYGLNELSIYSRCSLDDQSFAECPSLSHIYNYNAVPNTCNASVFDGLDKFSCTLHVPQGTTDKYRIASVWRDFYYMEEMVPTYTVSVETASADWGSVTGGGAYLSGMEITLRAVPATGYRFVRWNDGNTDNPRTVTVTEDATYTAVFDVLQLLVTVLPSNDSHGVVTGGGWYNYGETTVLEATPATSYYFYCWQDGSKDNPRTVTVTEDITYTATFRPYTFTVSATADDASRGEVTGSGTYGYGDIATLDAIAYTGYRFAHWSDGNTDNPRTIILTQDTALTAYFEEIPTYAVSLSCDAEQGTVSGGGTYREGDQVTISAMPNKGYEFVQWSDGNTDNPRSWIVTEDVSLSAIFQQITALPQTTAASQETQKVVKDGQVLILRNGKAYNMLGQEIR